MRILVVSAHPDDEVLGPGGSIVAHARAGHDVTIMLACCGTNLRYGREEADRLARTSEQVAATLGARKVVFGDLPDQALDTMTLTEVARRMEKTIESVDPQMIYTHYWGDINRDHRILCEAVMVAARPYAAPGVAQIIASRPRRRRSGALPAGCRSSPRRGSWTSRPPWSASWPRSPCTPPR